MNINSQHTNQVHCTQCNYWNGHSTFWLVLMHVLNTLLSKAMQSKEWMCAQRNMSNLTSGFMSLQRYQNNTSGINACLVQLNNHHTLFSHTTPQELLVFTASYMYIHLHYKNIKVVIHVTYWGGLLAAFNKIVEMIKVVIHLHVKRN